MIPFSAVKEGVMADTTLKHLQVADMILSDQEALPEVVAAAGFLAVELEVGHQTLSLDLEAATSSKLRVS